MKIGIITHELKNNYGGLLQNYALQQVLKSMGHEVYTIDRIKRVPYIIKMLSLINRTIKRIFKKNVKLRAWTTKKEDSIISEFTRQFVENNIATTKKKFRKKDLKYLHSEYGFNAYVVGSDQVWREDANGNDVEFLSFIPNDNKVKRIAYSASFGVDYWTFSKKKTRKYSYLAQKFDAISVREKSGIDLCRNYLKVDAIFMPDPTLLLSKEHYTNLSKKANVNRSKGELFAYILDKSEDKYSIVNEICKKLSLEAFEVMPEQSFTSLLPKKEKLDINKCIYPNVESWIQGFVDAKFIVTDSFHGTVFALIFNKPFISIQNSKRGTARFQTLLSLFNLEDRLITNTNSYNSCIIDDEIDYDKINKIIDELKKQAHNYFINVLQ